MLKPQRDLFNEFLGAEKAHTAARARMQRALDKLYRDYVLRIKDYLADSSDLSSVEIYDIVAATTSINKLTAILRDAGMEDMIAIYLEQFPELTKGALDYFKQFNAASMAGIDRQMLGTLIKYTEITLRTELDRKFVAPVQQAIMEAALGRASIADAVASITNTASSITTGQLEAYASNAYDVYLRTVTNEKAEALGMDVYIYVGPDDARTSEQCKEILDGGEHGVPGLYLRDEINDGMADGLDGDPFTNGGHFNCRHRFAPTTRARAIEQYGADL